MDRNRFARVEALFDAAMELPPDGWADFLADACAGDDDLRAEIERLLFLETAETADRSLERAVADAARELSAETGPTGRTLGAYRLIDDIGHGGMGTVWLAERADDEYRVQVAVKLVRGGFAHPELERRFRAERQILADLRHPNIARLLDGGTAPDGTPYLVMEYVDGEPITVHAERNGLALRERLRLFQEICDAVQHAHESLVVHRDIKPSNILVDADGQVKLLDFGIAKLLGDGADAERTQAGVRAMTPDYASPEQVRGEPVTTATDVYQLGVLLCELLTGARPGSAGTMPDDNPEAPSRLALRRRDAEALPDDRAALRGTGADRLARSIRGDLDTIAAT
ncbi:MAG TPA: serine/threonine-protein kinase, partial [Longimicrobiales bacterium]